MEIGHRASLRRKTLALLATFSALGLSVLGYSSLSKHIWADQSDTTRLTFSDALFCQRMSQAINDSLGDGMADGSDCVNRNLYVSTAAIGNIQTLDIVPPEGGFGNVDWDNNSINIYGSWTTTFFNLTSLSITNMHVANISALANLRGELTYLNLSNNKIGDITPLASLKDSLTELNLSGNHIWNGWRELHSFARLTTLNVSRTGFSAFYDLFAPDPVEYNPETGEPLTEEQPISELGKVLVNFDLSGNEILSYEKPEQDLAHSCEGSLYPLMTYSEHLTLSNLKISNSNLNSDDLYCIASVNHLSQLDVSSNHIDDFSPIRSKTYSTLKADSQVYTRTIESLDYSPLPKIFTQVQTANYFSSMPSATNVAVPLSSLDRSNAQFNGEKVRFNNAVIASWENEHPQPATITIPASSGVFANSKLQVYFSGQIVTFADANLCNRVYTQGEDFSAFLDVDGNMTRRPEDGPVVLTNACASTKQIAMIGGGSYLFVRLDLDAINNGSPVDLTGLDSFGSLQVLSLNNNKLSDISVLTATSALRHLWLNDNLLEPDDWWVITDYLYSLGILYLNNNHMNEISYSIGNLYSLGNLYLVNNGISDVAPLARASSLTVLDLSNNPDIHDFSSLASEESACNPVILKLENAGITSIPDANIIESGFSNLTSLNLNDNQLTDDTVSNLSRATRLDELYLNSNRLTSTSGFSGITKLKKLFLDNNQIASVSGLTSLANLAELHLASNRISDLTGLNTLSALATLDLKNQTLSGTISPEETTYRLPAVFSQATSMNFPHVANFPSTGNYTVTGGTLNSGTMTVTLASSSTEATVTIPDGGLAGTKITITSGSTPTPDPSSDLTELITDNTGGATIAITSADTFTVTSDRACMALLSTDGGTTWSRLTSSAVSGQANSRSFTVSSLDGISITVAYAGDVNPDNTINIRDARAIVSSITGRTTLTALQAQLADVDGSGSVNIRDARAIINNIIRNTAINW